MLIGITGKAMAGKDTIGQYLCKMYGFHPKAFADPMRDALKVMFALGEKHFNGDKEFPIEWLGKSPRQLMQTLGTEWGRDQVHRQIWVLHMQRRIAGLLKAGGEVVITDVRYVDEAEMVHRLGGQIWRVTWPNGLTTAQADHTSEQEGMRIVADVDLLNDGTVEDLHNKIDDAMAIATISHERGWTRSAA